MRTAGGTPIAPECMLVYNQRMVEKVGYTRPPIAARAARRAGNTSSVGFSDALSSAEAALGAGEVELATPVAALSSANSLLGLQEVEADEFKRRKAYKRGRLTLEALAQLRDALLLGALPIATIEKLERIVAQERSATNDPVLNSVLDEIELRAAVELAKLEVALGNNSPDI